jgi:hypothetical protein
MVFQPARWLLLSRLVDLLEEMIDVGPEGLPRLAFWLG